MASLETRAWGERPRQRERLGQCARSRSRPSSARVDDRPRRRHRTPGRASSSDRRRPPRSMSTPLRRRAPRIATPRRRLRTSRSSRWSSAPGGLFRRPRQAAWSCGAVAPTTMPGRCAVSGWEITRRAIASSGARRSRPSRAPRSVRPAGRARGSIGRSSPKPCADSASGASGRERARRPGDGASARRAQDSRCHSCAFVRFLSAIAISRIEYASSRSK
jgi:hypothetical protein